MVVSNLYETANLKVIVELTRSQCSSDRRAVAGCCERLGKTTRATEVCTCDFLMLVEPWIREFAQSIHVWIREAATVLAMSSVMLVEPWIREFAQSIHVWIREAATILAILSVNACLI